MPDADLGHLRFVGMGTDAMVDLFDKGVLDHRDVFPTPAVLSAELMGTARAAGVRPPEPGDIDGDVGRRA